MRSEIRIYSLRDYSGEPQLEALISQRQLDKAINGRLVRRDNVAGIWRLTPAGQRVMDDGETTYRD